MAEWREVELGSVVADVTVGHVGSMASEYRNAGIPFLRSQNILPHRLDLTDVKFVDESFHHRLVKSALSAGDVVTVRTGKPGTSAVIPEDFGLANCADLVITRPGAEVDAHWLSYYLNLVTNSHVAVMLVGAVQQHFNVGAMRALKLRLPPLAEQRAIADVLGALDDKIAANTKLATTANALSEQLFHAALAADEPRVGRFWDLFTVEFGAPFKGALFSGEQVGRPLIRIRDLKSHSPQVWTTEERVDEIVVESGDVIAGMDGDFTPTAWFGERGVLNQRVCRLSSGHSRALTLQAVIEPLSFVEGYKTGTTVAHLNKGDLLEAPARLPSEEAAFTFDRRASHLLDLQVALHTENARLSATRDTLLPALMSGRLRVEDAAEMTA